jgi:hypothetical protein
MTNNDLQNSRHKPKDRVVNMNGMTNNDLQNSTQKPQDRVGNMNGNDKQ